MAGDCKITGFLIYESPSKTRLAVVYEGMRIDPKWAYL